MTKMTREEGVAIKLMDILSDIRLDLDLIGYYFANFATKSSMGRLEEVLGSANETVGTISDRVEYQKKIMDEDRD